MTTKTLQEIDQFYALAKTKFAKEEKIAFALKNRLKPQIDKINKDLDKKAEPYTDDLVLLGLVHDEGDKKGSLRRDEAGRILYAPDVELALNKRKKEIQIEREELTFEIETYYLDPALKPKEFTEEDEEVFKGFIEFQK